MKHIRKIFESTNEDQLEDVEDIFTEYTDVKQTGSDGEEYSDCYIESDNPTYILVSVHCYLQSPTINNIGDFDTIYTERSDYLTLMKRLRVTLVRLTHLGYKWGMTFDDDAFFIKVYYKDTKLTLHDAFGGQKSMRYVDENIMKSVLKDVYGVNYSSSSYQEATSGYYGKRAEILIHFKLPFIQEANPLIKDLRDITKTVTYFSSFDKGNETREEKAFYEVELCNGGSYIRIKL